MVYALDLGTVAVIEIHPAVVHLVVPVCRVVASVQASHVVGNGIEIVVDWIGRVFEGADHVFTGIEAFNREIDVGTNLFLGGYLGIGHLEMGGSGPGFLALEPFQLEDKDLRHLVNLEGFQRFLMFFTIGTVPLIISRE
jgi:hypothetical protein